MKLTAEQIEKRRLQQMRTAERAREKALLKLADPEYRQEQYAKAAKARQRQFDRLRSPEHQQKKTEKKTAALAVSGIRRATPPAKVRSKGTKGRTPTAAEKRVMNAIGKLPCIACLLHGHKSELVSLHHINGRTKPGAHTEILPLCNWHHQHAAPAHLRLTYPWLVPIHADGNCGGPAAFELLNLPQRQLLDRAYELAGIEPINTNVDII